MLSALFDYNMTRAILAVLCVAASPVCVTCQPTNPECTGVMALRSPSGDARGPWEGPVVLYAPSDAGQPREWYSPIGINIPSLLVLENGTSFLAGRTCSGPEHPWLARAPGAARAPRRAAPRPAGNLFCLKMVSLFVVP